MNDPIFSLDEPCEAMEDKEDWSRCNTCDKSNSKLANCQFCGQLTCPEDLQHQKRFPKDSKFAVGQICFVCKTKFLYRECLNELLRRQNKQDLNLGSEMEKCRRAEDNFLEILFKLDSQRLN